MTERIPEGRLVGGEYRSTQVFLKGSNGANRTKAISVKENFYQLAIPAPKPPAGSYDQAAATRGKVVFEGKGKCATCHVPPLYTEPGNNLHAPTEIGVDSFQADRSPTHMYRTAPVAGLWSRQSRGFYHDGRFQTLDEVIQHYDQHLKLQLTDQESKDLVEFLKSL